MTKKWEVLPPPDSGRPTARTWTRIAPSPPQHAQLEGYDQYYTDKKIFRGAIKYGDNSAVCEFVLSCFMAYVY